MELPIHAGIKVPSLDESTSSMSIQLHKAQVMRKFHVLLVVNFYKLLDK